MNEWVSVLIMSEWMSRWWRNPEEGIPNLSIYTFPSPREPMKSANMRASYSFNHAASYEPTQGQSLTLQDTTTKFALSLHSTAVLTKWPDSGAGKTWPDAIETLEQGMQCTTLASQSLIHESCLNHEMVYLTDCYRASGLPPCWYLTTIICMKVTYVCSTQFVNC